MKLKNDNFRHTANVDETQGEKILKEQALILDFMDTVRKIENNGGFRAGGFFQINRGTVTSLVGTFLTYTLILMTWPRPEDDSIPDYLKDLCCFAYADLTNQTSVFNSKTLVL